MAARRKAPPLPGEEHLSRREGTAHWQIGFTVGGCRVRESSGTDDNVAAAALAKKRHDEVWREVKLGEKPKLEMTLNDAFVQFWEEKASKTRHGQTGQRYHMKVLLQAFGRTTLLSGLDDAVVNAAVQRMLHRKPVDGSGRPATLSGATVNRYLATLRLVCKRAKDVWKAEVGEWSYGEHRQEEAKHREVFLTHEQARALVDAAVPHLKPILMLALATGLRRDNVVRLRWEDVSLDMARLLVVQKGERRLSVDLPDLAVRMLAALQPDPEKRRGPVFYLGNPAVACGCTRCASPRFVGKPIKDVKRSFATAARLAGVRDHDAGRLRFHDLRHSHASWLLAATGDLLLTSKRLGHANVATTQRYAHLLPGRMERAVEQAVSGLLDNVSDERKKA
jgi:integrase